MSSWCWEEEEEGGGEELKPFFFLLEFFIMSCLNLSMEISFGTKSGHQVI